MKTSFYDDKELEDIGFKRLGDNVLVSRKASIYSSDKIELGDNVRIDDFTLLSGQIKMGNNTHLGTFTGLYGHNGIELEEFVGISSHCLIWSASDDYSGEYMSNPTVPDEFRHVSGGKVTLKKHTVIGSSCVILPNITLAEGTSVGAMSLINKPTEEWSIYVGIPAKKIRDRKRNVLNLEEQYKALENI